MADRFLLDTCTYLWLASESERLSKDILDLCRDSSTKLYLSLASVWELGIKNQKNGFFLSEPLDRFIKETNEDLGVDLLPISVEACAQLRKLPDIHRDPFDRLIIAEGIVHGLVIVTSDSRIHEYPVRVCW